MKSLPKLILAGALALASTYGGFLAWRAHKNLVTLHVRNAPIQDVAAKLRWQTWETFVVNTNVSGTVTLDVDRMPLESVLTIVGEQMNARWSTIYPIYRDKASLVSLKRALHGDVQLSNTPFTNYAGQGVGMGMRGEPGTRESRPVSLHLANTELETCALALERFGGGRVVIEKNAQARVTLELKDAPFAAAVHGIADNARLSVTKLYALETMRGPGQMAFARGEGGSRPGGQREINPSADSQRSEKMLKVMEVLPEDEQKRVEARELERMAVQSLPQEQRQQVMAERMNSPEAQARMEQRSVSGIKNTTPEQRRDRYERMYQMRKARAASNATRS